jgi:hypothetical protein
MQSCATKRILPFTLLEWNSVMTLAVAGAGHAMLIVLFTVTAFHHINPYA